MAESFFALRLPKKYLHIFWQRNEIWVIVDKLIVKHHFTEKKNKLSEQMLQYSSKIVYSQDFIQMQIYPFANIQKGNGNGESKIMKLFRDWEYGPFTEDFEEILD